MQPITTGKKTSSLTKEEVLNQQVEQLKGTMNDNVTKVDKSWGYKKTKNGSLKIVLHHSSLPYEL